MSGAAPDALGPSSEARRRFERLGQAGNASAARMASVSLTEHADCLTDLGRLDQAADGYETIRGWTSKRSDRERRYNKGQLGRVRMVQRRYPDALAAYDEARETFERLGEPASVATAWRQIAVVQVEAGQYEPAEHAYQESLQIEVSAATVRRGALSANSATSIPGKGREEAGGSTRQAADIDSAPDLPDLASEGLTRNNIADEPIELGRHDEARREIHRAISATSPWPRRPAVDHLR